LLDRRFFDGHAVIRRENPPLMKPYPQAVVRGNQIHGSPTVQGVMFIAFIDLR